MLRASLVLLALFTALTGLAYPVLVTSAAHVLFPGQAAGSLIQVGGLSPDLHRPLSPDLLCPAERGWGGGAERGWGGGTPAGSALVGQPFSDPRWFWSRPSATSPVPYEGRSSSGSNLGPTNPALLDAVKARVAALREADPGNGAPIPVDLVTASGSGLDPHLSPAAALYQVPRVARARGLPEARVRELVEARIERPALSLLGPPVVNVLALNLALDGLSW